MESYLPSPDKKIWHERDIEYFQEFSAPVYENMQRMHFTNINSTNPYFSVMLYLFARQIGAEQILEIGHAEGFTSFYLAHAVKDNAIRFQMPGNRYYGIDIVQTEKVRENLEAEGLPVTIMNLDSMKLTKDTFPNVIFDIIFQDANHDTEYVIHEFKTMWPQVKGYGNGYFICHDAYGPAEEGCREILKIIEEQKIPVEYLRIPGAYGLLIIRNMEGYDYEKRHWTD